jgi:DHA2 family multidrug resistance protein
MTTIIARRAQFHQFRFIEHLNPFDAKYQMVIKKAQAVLAAKGQASSHSANGLIYQELMRQAHLFAFTDAFYIGAVIILCVIALIFLLKRPAGVAALKPIH